jgi:hypothetical protein
MASLPPDQRDHGSAEKVTNAIIQRALSGEADPTKLQAAGLAALRETATRRLAVPAGGSRAPEHSAA